MSFDVTAFRREFPIFSHPWERFDRPLIYFDNAATTQIPKSVIQAISDHLAYSNANVHRGVYALSARAELAYESIRQAIAKYIHAASPEEIIYNSGTTEGLNFLAYQFRHLTPDDEIILTIQEHHSNLLPWQRLNATIQYVGMDDKGDFDYEDFLTKLSSKTKLVSVALYNNVLGTINPLKKITQEAHRIGALCIVDGAQALLHGPVNVDELDCDFFTTSFHKCFGPTGIGFLYGKRSLLEQFQPVRVGGGIVERVFTGRPAIYRGLPDRLEAGTPNIVGAVGAQAALTFLKNCDWPAIQAHLMTLQEAFIHALHGFPENSVLFLGNQRIPIISWTHGKVHPHDIATILDTEGIAIRAGQHCASPLMQALKISGCVRASLAPYNTLEEIEIFAQALSKINSIFS